MYEREGRQWKTWWMELKSWGGVCAISTSLSYSLLCCRSRRMLRIVCVCVPSVLHMCVFTACTVSLRTGGGFDRLSVVKQVGGVPFLSSFSTVTHLLAPLSTAQGHCNTAKVWTVHDTRSSREWVSTFILFCFSLAVGMEQQPSENFVTLRLYFIADNMMRKSIPYW